MLCFQLHGKECTDDLIEYIDEKSINNQVGLSFGLIEEYEPDLVVFPEICYLPSFEEQYYKYSKNRLIVAGSEYIDGVNTTVVFKNGKKITLPKIYPSPHEPMFVTNEIYREPLAVINEWEEMMKKGQLPDYFIRINEKKHIALLNCLDYYKLAYYVARSPILSDNLVAIVSPCSNNRLQVFMEETKALHNHNNTIYSIIVNSVASLDEKPYSIGNSYIFGVIDSYSHSLNQKKGLSMEHPSSVLHLKDENVAFFMEVQDSFNPIKRSDHYKKNPIRTKLIPLNNSEETIFHV